MQNTNASKVAFFYIAFWLVYSELLYAELPCDQEPAATRHTFDFSKSATIVQQLVPKACNPSCRTGR